MTMLHSVAGCITPQAPFDFSQTRDTLWSLDEMLGEPTSNSTGIAKALMVNGKAIGMMLRSVGYLEKPQLEYELFADEPLSEDMVEATVGRIQFVLSLNDDLTPFYETAKADTPFSPIIRRFYGLHQVKYTSPFEAVCWSILTQRCLVSISRRMRQLIVETYGQEILLENGPFRAFPEPQHLAGIPLEDLSQCIGDAKRAEQILHAAHCFSEVDTAWLLEAEYKTVERWLENINGMGLSTAIAVLTHALGRMEQIPLTHKKLITAIKKIYGPSINRADIPKLAEQYGPWQGYWVLYLLQASEK